MIPELPCDRAAKKDNKRRWPSIWEFKVADILEAII